MTARELIARLQTLPQDQGVLLAAGAFVWDIGHLDPGSEHRFAVLVAADPLDEDGPDDPEGPPEPERDA